MPRSKHFYHYALIALMGLSACSKSPEEEPVATVIEEPLPEYEPASSFDDVQKTFDSLPPETKKLLGPAFFETLENYARTPDGLKYLERIQVQASEQPDFLPIFPQLTIPLEYSSKYDGFSHGFFVHAPYDPSKAQSIVIYLGTEQPDSQLAVDPGAWQVVIPSRPQMNYQLVSEGDFWSILDTLEVTYPQLAQCKRYLVGRGDAANAALFLANHYRSYFQGILFSGGSLGLNLPNLDGISIIHLESDLTPPTAPWGGAKLITRLQSRGNTQAFNRQDKLQNALNDLILTGQAKKAKTLASYSFKDYQYAQAYPWLRVLSKESEARPVAIRGEIKDNTIRIDSPNIRALELSLSPHKGMPSSINRLVLNDEIYAFNPRLQKVVIGTETINSFWKKKVEAPGGFINFFRNEPVYLVYQDENVDTTFKTAAKNLAQSLSQLSLSGLPPLDVKLPVLALSEYRAQYLPPHRVIAIGRSTALKSIVSQNPDYFPLKREPSKLTLNHQSLSLPYKNFDHIAYGIIYPPEENSSLKLALLLCSENTEGLQTLAQHYSSAIALYRPSDFSLWTHNNGRYQLAVEKTFDSYWGQSDIPEAGLRIPYRSRQAWSRFLQNFLVKETGIASLALPTLADNYAPIPMQLSHGELSSFVPDRNFAVLSVNNSKDLSIIAKLLRKIPDLDTYGLDYLDPQSTTQNIPQALNFKVLLDVTHLNFLAPSELLAIQYQVFPYSFQEMLSHRLEDNPQAMGRDLMRVSDFALENNELEGY